MVRPTARREEIELATSNALAPIDRRGAVDLQIIDDKPAEIVGDALFEHCAELGIEGIVSKRIDKPYVSGPTRYWRKTKCPEWRRANAERCEGPRKPELTEAQKTLAKKREELARVRERLRDPDLRSGIARELRKHIAILEQEIAELEQA